LAGRKTGPAMLWSEASVRQGSERIDDVSVAVPSSGFFVEYAWEYLDIKLICTRCEDAIHD
jgi:hypothetical protein